MLQNIVNFTKSHYIEILLSIAIVLVGVYLILQVKLKENLDNTSPTQGADVAKVVAEAGVAASPAVSDKTVSPGQNYGNIMDKKMKSCDMLPKSNTRPFDYGDDLSPFSLGATGGTNVLQPSDLLPKSTEADVFNKQFPQGASPLSNKNFLTTGYDAGISTISPARRNANLQIRSDPYIPVQNVGPWNQSTITPDLNQRTFELGGTC